MTDKQQDQTIQGQYHVMPDGQVLQKMTDGNWIPTEDRLKQAEQSITEQFKDTTTIPNNWTQPTSENLVRKKHRNIEDLIKNSSTHRHLHAHLIEMLGSPTEIIKNHALNESIKGKIINDYHIKRSAEQIIKALNCEPWNTVLKIMEHRSTDA